MAKIAILLTGFSYGMRNDTRTVKTDWNQAKHEVKSQVIDCFVSQGHDVSVYLTTYHSEQVEQIVNFYNPKGTLILPFEGSEQRATYIQSLKQMITEDVDVIVSTRFDIAFKQPVTSLNLDFEKFNFFARTDKLRYWVDSRFIDDVIFVFPKRYLPYLIETVEELIAYNNHGEHLHPTYNRILPKIGESNTNFMVEEYNVATSGKYYELLRRCHCDLNVEFCYCWKDLFSWQGESLNPK